MKLLIFQCCGLSLRRILKILALGLMGLHPEDAYGQASQLNQNPLTFEQAIKAIFLGMELAG